jgi:aspartyl-tRNA(Asn)/glutamyl-tRNA(Gln) amidotransferase subunit B
MNSFRNVERAADYEIGRQIQLLENGQLVTQETRGWDEQKTYLMREKEEAQDYRYFPEPDIPPLELDRAKREQMEQELPPLLTHVRQTLQATGLEQTKIEALINQPRLAMLGLSVLEEITDPASRARIVNWLTSEVVRLLRADNFDWDDFALSVGQLRELSDMTAGDELNSSAAKQVLGEMVTSTRSPRQIAEEKQLIQTSDAGEIESIVDQIIQNNPQAAQDVRDGESKAIGFLTGEVMKASQGQTNPRVVKDLLEHKLNQ